MKKHIVKNFFLVSFVVTTAIGAISESFYNGRKVLVTGGCGFIGSHIVEKLVDLGATVTILDNLSTGSLANIASVKDHVTLIKGDIADFQDCLRAAQGQSVIFHLAALLSVQDSMQNPQNYFDINVRGTTNLLEAARINNVHCFIFSSSAAVYGAKETICTEEDECHPLSPYGFSKLMGEMLCHFYFEQFGIRSLSLRYFNVYGSRQNPHGSYAAVVPKFRHNMQRNLPLTVFGDGLQTRDFVSVDFIAQCNVDLASIDSSRLCGQVCNVATGKSITLLELIDTLKQDFPDYSAAIMHKDALPGDIRHSTAAVSRLQNFFKNDTER